MLLLDTCVVSELRKQPSRLTPAVAAWNQTVNAAEAFLSAITILEIERGIESVQRRDPNQAAILRHWLQGQVLPGYLGRILPVDVPVARRAGHLHVPDRQPWEDALIAATALVHGLTVVTRNVSDFAVMGVPTVNPWDHAG